MRAILTPFIRILKVPLARRRWHSRHLCLPYVISGTSRVVLVAF